MIALLSSFLLLGVFLSEWVLHVLEHEILPVFCFSDDEVEIRTSDLRACLNSLQSACGRAERDEAARGHSFRSSANKTCSGPCRILGLTSRISTNGIFAHATTPTRSCAQIGVDVHLVSIYTSNE